MSQTEHDHRASRPRSVAASAVAWNTVMPALGLALILGVAVLPALVVAAAAALTIHVVLGGERRRGGERREWPSAHFAPGHAARGI